MACEKCHNHCEIIHKLKSMFHVEQFWFFVAYNVPHGTMATYNLHYRKRGGWVYVGFSVSFLKVALHTSIPTLLDFLVFPPIYTPIFTPNYP